MRFFAIFSLVLLIPVVSFAGGHLSIEVKERRTTTKKDANLLEVVLRNEGDESVILPLQVFGIDGIVNVLVKGTDGELAKSIRPEKKLKDLDKFICLYPGHFLGIEMVLENDFAVEKGKVYVIGASFVLRKEMTICSIEPLL
jgi:hypothetical protein